jgi:hypothetical protein
VSRYFFCQSQVLIEAFNLRERFLVSITLLALCIALSGPVLGMGLSKALIADAAIPSWTGGIVGIGNTSSRLDIWVSVIGLDGDPLFNMSKNDFRVTVLMAPEDLHGSDIAVADVSEVPAKDRPRIYDLALDPAGNRTWAKGSYVLLIEASHGRDEGRVMVPFTVTDAPP